MKDNKAVQMWHGYELTKMNLDGVEVSLVKADSPLKGNPWLWRARFFNASPSFDLAMLRHGFHLAHIDISDLTGGPEAMRRMDLLYKHLTEVCGFSAFPLLEAYSRGALAALNWGIRNPEKLSAICLENPICNLEFWPTSLSEKKMGRKNGILTETGIVPEWNPVGNLLPLAENQIPVITAYDDHDESVSPEQNSVLLIKRLLEFGGKAKAVVCRDSIGSDDAEKLVQFALAAWKEHSAK